MRADLTAQNLLLLPRFARRAGVAVDPERARSLLRALAEVDLAREDDVRAAARAALVSRRADQEPFDEAFDLFWRILAGGALRVHGVAPRTRHSTSFVDVPSDATTRAAGRPTPRTLRVVASLEEVLRRRDFADMTAAERAAAARFLQRLRWSPGVRRSRRFAPDPSGPLPDARATFRRSLRAFGEPIVLARRARRMKRRPLVLLCDVSGSMEAYSRLLLHLAHSLAQGWGRVEAFTFGTRLTRITRELRHRRPEVALAHSARRVPDWSGGTRIADALHEFNRGWSRRVLGRGAIVLLCTDGWERGDPERLAAEAARLQRSTYRLLWLDPLSATHGYAPEAGGARALAAHVDDHLASNTLDGLATIAALLEGAGRTRPVRRQSGAR